MAPRASARHLHISPNISPTTTATRMALATLVALATMAPLASAQLRPPNLSPDNLPDTAFTCEDKVTGGYYADMEADCQLFHVCVQVSEYEFQDFHFLCPNDTVFDQQHLVCTNWFEVDCHAQLAVRTHPGLVRWEKATTQQFRSSTESEAAIATNAACTSV